MYFHVKFLALLLVSSETCTGISKHPIILLTAFDGFRFDYFSRGLTPILDEIANNGTRADYLLNQFPTITFPNFHSISTGMYPEVHGVLGNSVFNENGTCIPYGYELFHYNEEIIPIWNLNELSGDDRYSGVMMWPGSDLEYQRRHPTFYHGYDNVTSWQTRVDTVLDWILNETTPANLVLLYFEQPDAAGHHFGPDSDELNQQLVRINNITGYLMRKLTENGIRHLVNLLFLADHGMATIQKVINLDEYVDPNAYTACSGSPGLQILPHAENEDEVLKNLTAASAQLNSFQVYTPDRIPQRWHYKNNRRNIGYLVEANISYVFQDVKTYRGDHGYDNTEKKMHPMFFANGPLLKKRYKIEPFHNIDLYPLIGLMLKLTPPPKNVTPNGTLSNVISMLGNTDDDYQKYEYNIL